MADPPFADEPALQGQVASIPILSGSIDAIAQEASQPAPVALEGEIDE
jgi:hypothetical protein